MSLVRCSGRIAMGRSSGGLHDLGADLFTINSASMLKGAPRMNLAQGIMMLIHSFPLIVFWWSTIGGIAGMGKVLQPYRLLLATLRGIGPYLIAMLALNGLVGLMAQPHMIAAVGTGENEQVCRACFLYGNFTKRFCTIGWGLIGLMVRVMVMTVQGFYGVYKLPDPDDAFGFAGLHLLFPGGVGLLIAFVMAANMTASSAFMVNSGALFTRNIYGKYIVRSKSDRHYLLAETAKSDNDRWS